jgi:hypothetical protein
MQINPDWNYGYLRVGHSYGAADKAKFDFDALGIGEVAKAFQAGVGYFSQRDQIAANDRERRLALRQQAGDTSAADAKFENLMIMFGQKQQVALQEKQAAAQTDVIKNVVLGVVALSLVGALAYGIYAATKD